MTGISSAAKTRSKRKLHFISNYLTSVYKDLGFEKFRVKFCDRPENRSGSDEVWDRAETALLAATRKAGS